MRLVAVILSVLAALALWVWATGPGTTLWLAMGGWVFCAVVGRVTFLLLRPAAAPGDTDTGPDPATPPAAATVIHPRQPHRHRP